MAPEMLARTLTNALNPFVIFTAIYALVAFAETDTTGALAYVVLELLAAAAVTGYVLYMRRRRRVGDFWISARAERLTPALFLLAAFVVLLGALALLDAPENLFLLTLSMGLASVAVALLTLLFKASAHCTVAGHAAAAGLLLLGPLGWIFAIALPPVIWARVTPGEHTALEALTGAAVGVGFAALFLG
jgi:hypothetical protein